MKVNSPLANMEMYVGLVIKQGAQLVIHSRDDSSMQAQVYIAPEDAWDFLKGLLRRPSSLLSVLIMPLLGMGKRRHRPTHSVLEDTLNNPWHLE